MLPVAAALAGCARSPAAPRFAYTLLDGSRHHSQALRGHVVLVDFWATTCTVCLAQMPGLVELHREYAPRGLVMLAVAIRQDPPARVAHYAQSRGLPFGVAIDNTGAIALAFGGIDAIPSGFLLDRQGTVARRWTGAQNLGELREAIDSLLRRV